MGWRLDLCGRIVISPIKWMVPQVVHNGVVPNDPRSWIENGHILWKEFHICDGPRLWILEVPNVAADIRHVSPHLIQPTTFLVCAQYLLKFIRVRDVHVINAPNEENVPVRRPGIKGDGAMVTRILFEVFSDWLKKTVSEPVN